MKMWGQFPREKASECSSLSPIATESISKIDIWFQLRHVLLDIPRVMATVFNVDRELQRVTLETTHAHHALQGLLPMARGLIQCTGCPMDTIADGPGQRRCEPCQAGFTSNAERTECRKCSFKLFSGFGIYICRK